VHVETNVVVVASGERRDEDDARHVVPSRDE
jgi:hypothetical protein